MAKDQQHYEVSLIRGFPAARHIRAGVTILPGDKQIVQLSKDQVEAMKDDRYVEVRKVSAKEANAGASTASVGSDTGTGESDTGGEAASAETGGAGEMETPESNAPGVGDAEVGGEGPNEGYDSSPNEAAPGQGHPQLADASDEIPERDKSETGGGAPDVDSLVRDRSREELDKMAADAGVDSPANLGSKKEVAQAIVDARQE